jgi:hypothetical protein
MAGKQRLNINLEELFPGEPLKIGNDTIFIRPMGLLQLTKITRQLNDFMSLLSKENITFDNYTSPENLIKVVSILFEKFPDILEESSNISFDDLQHLPIDIITDIIVAVVKVNIKSKDSLVGNFNRLAQMITVKKDEKKEN